MGFNNSHVTAWVHEAAAWLTPEKIVWVNGTEAEYSDLCSLLVEQGFFTKLNPREYPNSYWCVSDSTDVARVEERTFICSAQKEQAGPLNNWADAKAMYAQLHTLMAGCMRGRTMYVIPYLMGPDGSPYSKVGFELTDSPYVVVNMMIMSRVGEVALKNLGSSSDKFVRGVHSVGTIDPEKRYICHFPQDNTIISFNSNYGGNALQGKKCFALRIASTQALAEGWMAEHMLILGVTNPQGEKHYVCAAFPSACGKTNFAMLIPPALYQREGWKVETVGDDIAWLNFGSDGRLYAINPEAGFFGVAPGTSNKTNPNAMQTLHANTIFTNTALDPDTNTPWWEGMSDAPQRLVDWHKKSWTRSTGTPAAHANSRFTSPAKQCPSIDPNWERAEGVPISAIIFGGRRARTAPLVYQSRSWQHGTFVGATIASEMTAAASGKIGELRRDPMAMRPFIGYHAGDYFKHWLSIGDRPGAKLPSVFHVNWFRTDTNGRFLWPGFGENMRVLEWILARCTGKAAAVETPLGFMPRHTDLRLEGLNLPPEALDELLAVRPKEWEPEIQSQHEFLTSIGPRVPAEIWSEHNALKARLAG